MPQGTAMETWQETGTGISEPAARREARRISIARRAKNCAGATAFRTMIPRRVATRPIVSLVRALLTGKLYAVPAHAARGNVKRDSWIAMPCRRTAVNTVVRPSLNCPAGDARLTVRLSGSLTVKVFAAARRTPSAEIRAATWFAPKDSVSAMTLRAGRARRAVALGIRPFANVAAKERALRAGSVVPARRALPASSLTQPTPRIVAHAVFAVELANSA